MKRTILGAAVAAFALSACGGGGGGKAAALGTTPIPPSAATLGTTTMPPMDMTSAPPVDQTPVAGTAVMINNFAFQPAVLTVKVGQTITWTNHDEEPHTVVGVGMKSPVLGNAGSTYAHVFTTPGTYHYNCSIHPFMHGTVVVTA